MEPQNKTKQKTTFHKKSIYFQHKEDINDANKTIETHESFWRSPIKPHTTLLPRFK